MKWNKVIVDTYNLLIPYSLIPQPRPQLVRIFPRQSNWNLIPEWSESSLALHLSAYCRFSLTSTFGWKYWEVRKECSRFQRVLFAPVVQPPSPESGSIHSRVIPFFICWFSGIRSPKCQAAASSSRSVEPLLRPLVEACLSWVATPSNQENLKLRGGETKILNKSILII